MTNVVIYVGRKPCGCQKGQIRSDAPDVSRVGGFLKHGGGIQTMTPETVEQIPRRCAVCAPEQPEQMSLFGAEARP